MPQLDFFSISNQFFWGIFYFIFFYLLINFFVIPSIFSSIFARQAVISGTAGGSSDSIIYIFSAFSLFAFFLSELDINTAYSETEMQDAEINFFFAIRTSLSFELANIKIELFDEIDSE